ncbi:MAG: ATP-binding protein [Planctomycetes bacterium]|nr:ATP-binding protein [Planctomycetota bacterium]
MEPLRIYVCGAHSTGKTTLARHLAQELGLPLINEVARQVMAEMELSFETLRVDLKQVGEYQKEVFRRQLNVEDRFPDGFVSDRAFCNLAYAARHSNALPEILASVDAQNYFEHLRRHGLVFYVRPHRECMQDDGFRERVAWDEINRIDGILDFIFGWQQIPCIGISELNMKDRVRTAQTAVRLYQRALAGRSTSTLPLNASESEIAAKLGKLRKRAPQRPVAAKVEPHESVHAVLAEGSSGHGASAHRVPLSALWSDLA